MTIEQNDWEFELSFGSVLPQSLDDFFLQSDNTTIEQFRDEIPAEAVANVAVAPSEDVSSWIGEMENFLMDDDDNGAYADHDHQIGDLEQILLSPSTPLPISGDKGSSDSKDSDTNSDPEKAETNPDCLSKKQLRKLKNKDAAVRSRERRKTYVKELEMKSKYMEAECRRLDRLLQCCYAENHMLRVSLHSATAFSGCMAKAESAVLLSESLLLGSLLWLLVTVCLLPQPKEAASPQNANKDLELLPQRRSKGRKLTQLWVPPSFLSKRCSSSRTKMKVVLLETYPIIVCS
ncbi:hypothetical protein V2J09_012566 [Rumex salicifolius]